MPPTMMIYFFMLRMLRCGWIVLERKREDVLKDWTYFLEVRSYLLFRSWQTALDRPTDALDNANLQSRHLLEISILPSGEKRASVAFARRDRQFPLAFPDVVSLELDGLVSADGCQCLAIV